MRNTITFAFVALAGVALAAQGQQQRPSSSSQPPQTGTVTVTGCLVAGPNNSFTLTTADTSGSSAGSSSNTEATGTTATTPAGSKVVKTITYALSPGSNVDLKGNAGHKVQVTGTATPAQASASSTDASATTGIAQGTSGKTPVVQTTAQAQIVARQLTVNSVKTVAAKCDILK